MKQIALAIALTGVAVLPSAGEAKTYDFAGDFGVSVFEYGSGTGGSTFTSLPRSGNCVSNTSFPCRSSSDGNLTVADLPAIGVNTGATTINAYTFSLPSQTVYLHPGQGANSDAILAFVAPRAGTYSINYNFSRLDNTANGNGVTLELFVNGSTLVGGNSLNQFGSGLVGVGGFVNLNQGDRLSLAVGNAGDVSYDSTGLTGSISGAVPEPAAWAMMIAGFGMVGFAMRRRNAVRTTVAYA